MTMRKRFLAPLLLTASMAGAQQLAETIEVRVTSIDVVVTDRAGHPVHDLTKDDFELYENRKLQPITNFYEIKGETPDAASASKEAAVAPPEMRKRSVVVFIDNSSIDPLRRNQVIDSLMKAINTLVRPGDDAMVATWNRHFETAQRFSDDHATLKHSLDAARDYGASASAMPVQKANVMNEARAMLAAAREGRMKISDAYAASVDAARAYAESMRQTEILLLRSMTQTTSMLSGVDGKKILIFVGGELEEHPGLDVFQLVDSLFAGAIRNMMPAVIREGGMNTTADVLKLARNAKANGVTIYMLDALDRTGDAAESAIPDPEVEFTNETNSYFSMVRLASNTGGTVLSGSRNFALALDNISRDLGSYYSLGCRPSDNGGTDRSINVKVKRPGLVVRSRHGYAIRTADEQTNDHVIANAFHSSIKGDFPVVVAADKPESFEKHLFKVKLTITFPSSLTYLPDGENVAGEYTVFFATAQDDGAVSPVGKQVQSVKFPATTLEAVKRRPFTHSTVLVVRAGTQTLSVAVFDRYGARTGYARTTINAR